MSNDCKECLQMSQYQKKSKSLSQMSEEERQQFWNSFRELAKNVQEAPKIDADEEIS